MSEETVRRAVPISCLFMCLGGTSRWNAKKFIDLRVEKRYIITVGRGYWEEPVAFTRSLFGATFKTNPYMEKAIMTEITRVSDNA